MSESRLDVLESEYRLLQMEREFSQKKLSGQLTDEDRYALRAARQAFRLDHRLPKVEGASPAPIGTKTKWQRIMEVLRED